MSEYCTPHDVRFALTPDGDATDQATGAGLDDVQIRDAIEEASSTVELYLSGRYILPTEPGEQLNLGGPVKFWTRNIAAYLCALTYRKNKDLPDEDPIVRRYKSAMDSLTHVKGGEFDVALPTPDADDGQVWVGNQYEGQMFTMDDVGIGYDGTRVQRFEIMGGN